MLPPFWALASIAWRQYILRFDTILFAHLLFTVPAVALAVYLKQPYPLAETVTELVDLWPNAAIRLGIDYGLSLLTLPVVAIVILRLKAGVEQRALSLWSSARRSLTLLPILLVVHLLDTVATLVGFTLFLIPGLVVSSTFALVTPIIVWKGFSLGKALQYAWSLIKGQLFWTVVYLFVVQLLINLVMLLIVWGLPISIWFDLFISVVSAISVSYYTIFAVIMFNTLEAIQPKKP